MPFQSKRAKLVLPRDVRENFMTIVKARKESASRVERVRILLAYSDGETVSAIARQMRTNRPKVERCIDKALELGGLAALRDLPGRGKHPTITPEDRAWVISLACQKPKHLGYPHEMWTTALLGQHIRREADRQRHPSLRKLSRGTVSKILTQSRIRPHKIAYYLERRDPDFEAIMAQVLFVYKEVELLREKEGTASGLVAYLSYDEKPGIQAIGTTAPDLPPVPGQQPEIHRDHEYVRYGTVSLLAGIDLLTGQVHGMVVNRHRSREFITFLKSLAEHYPPEATIRIVLDNHSAHISKETRSYLATVPNRFQFVFTPKHGSWLNLIESFFAKMAKSLLRGIRVDSKAELKERIEQYLNLINETPVVFRWKYKLDELSVAQGH